jgi:hypothetical protein
MFAKKGPVRLIERRPWRGGLGEHRAKQQEDQQSRSTSEDTIHGLGRRKMGAERFLIASNNGENAV